ncbi:MAG: hypothetical protein ABXS91_05895 [Sulfurimonas sp.]
MKKFLLNLLTFGIVIAIIVILLLSLGTDQGARYVYKGNSAYEPVVIQPKEYQCSECSMDIEEMAYSAQIITPEGDTYFFDDIGCVVDWLEGRKIKTQKVITRTLDTDRWIDVDKAWYTRTASSPMGYGFAAYEHKQEGFIPYEEMRLLMLQGKHLHDPFVKKSLLGQ